MLSPIAVLFPTYNRPDYAKQALEAAIKNLRYDRIMWYLADAGSDDDQYPKNIARINEELGDIIIGGHSEKLSPGQNWNKGIKHIFDTGIDIYLRLEDDFVLQEPLDLRPYVRLLREKTNVCMVRLGLLPINLEADTVGHKGEIYLNIHKNRQYAYSGHPGLVHKRFHDVYGYFHEELGPGDCEIDMDAKVRRNPSREIWWPVAMGPFGKFAHIGERQSYQ